MRVRRWLVPALAGLLSLSLAVPASADPNDDQARVKRELAAAAEDLEAATAKAQQAAASYAEAVSALPGAQAALADAQGRVAAAEAAFRQAERDAEVARAVQVDADRQFDTAQGRVESARGQAGRFAAATYKGGGFLLLGSLVDAGSPNEFAYRMRYLDVVAGEQRTALRALTDARAQLSEQRSIAAAANRRAQDAAAAAQEALVNSRSAAIEAGSANQRVQALIDQRQAAVAAAESEKDKVLAQYEALKGESARLETDLRAAGSRPGPRRSVVPLVPGSTFFGMPVHGRKSSDFGRRFHPIFHTWLMHTGMDLAAGLGAPIQAAADGEVVQAGWRGGYGNLTCISHGLYQGRDVATCYGHQSEIDVHPGQQVRRGEIIGRVGTTGTSTGPHLHFEVRVAGTPVDPGNWLPGCLC